jgi:2-polyprenyl-6-methoxyphenol hydroxylase-like FAD-dependent oxidoreductase
MVSILLLSQSILLLMNCISETFAFSDVIPIVDVVICGGGLGGLALANGLIHNGFSVSCFERNSEFRPTGAQLGLSPNALKALSLLKPGLDTKIYDDSVTFPEFPGTAISAWATVRNLLLPSDLDLHLSSEFIDFEDKEDAFIESRFSCKENGIENKIHTVRSRVFIAADGIHSSVRYLLLGCFVISVSYIICMLTLLLMPSGWSRYLYRI